jgi:hypothetical protein
MLRKSHRYRLTRIGKYTDDAARHRIPQSQGTRLRRLCDRFIAILNHSKTGVLLLGSVIYWLCSRVELFSAISKNPNSQFEAPKEITQRDRWRAVRACFLHLIPMIITAVLLTLNCSEVYLEAVGTSNQNARLNALQFAAKLHEVLIAASLLELFSTASNMRSCMEGFPLVVYLPAFKSPILDLSGVPDFGQPSLRVPQ